MATSVESAMPVRAWKSDRMAEKWLADARAEAQRGGDLADTLKRADREAKAEVWQALAGSVRREIVFAACFAEAHLFEYVRDFVIGAPGACNFDLFREFMFEPLPGKRKALRDELRFAPRWKKAIRALHSSDRMRDPDKYLMGGAWKDLRDLVHHRNNLAHANVGLPREAWDDDKMYEPSPATLVKLGPGWATRVVLANARELHALNTADRDPPGYVRES